MRETDNNKRKNENILSIRLVSDGLYFSVISPSEGAEEKCMPFFHDEGSIADALERIMGARKEFSGEYSSVQIFLDTADTVYVPAELIEAGADSDSASVEAYLNDAGVYLSKSEKAVVSPAVGELCAVIAFDSKTIGRLKAQFGDKAVFFSPLQENIEIRGRLDMGNGGYIVNLTENNLYITSFGDTGKLLIAEVYPCESAADIVYYLHAITNDSGADGVQASIYLYGSRAKDNIKTVRKYFGGALCV